MDTAKTRTTTDKMHDCAMNHRIYIVVDDDADDPFIAFCSTLDKARDLCCEYSEAVYGKPPYETDEMWIYNRPLDCLIDFDEI